MPNATVWCYIGKGPDVDDKNDKALREEASRRHIEIWDSSIGLGFAESNKLFESKKVEPPEFLLHFTSAAALVSIIQKRTLRVSRARSSNDPKELDHALDLARDEQTNLIQGPGDEIFRDELFASFRGELADGTERRSLDPHMCCFTEADNAEAVAHWAMYGRDGSGFALKFRSKALDEIENVSLAKICYNEQEQRSRLRDLLMLGRRTSQRAAEYAQPKYGGGWAERSFRIAAHAFGGFISVHAAAMKAPVFAAEKEWRLVHPGVEVDEKAEGHGSKPVAVPAFIEAKGPILRTFFEVTFKPDDLAAVVVGPVHGDLNRPVVKRMLEEGGYSNTEVETGKVALRVLREGG